MYATCYAAEMLKIILTAPFRWSKYNVWVLQILVLLIVWLRKVVELHGEYVAYKILCVRSCRVSNFVDFKIMRVVQITSNSEIYDIAVTPSFRLKAHSAVLD